MQKPITLYLIGFRGVGKYTIAQKLTNFGYKLVDNHLINNPIFSLLNLDSINPIQENAWKAIEQLRKIVLDFTLQDRISNYVFTNELLEENCDHNLFNEIKNIAKKRGAIFIPIKLTIETEDEHKKRVLNPQRKKYFKDTKWPIKYIQKELIKINHPNLYELDITDLSPTKAAKQIINFVDKHNH